MTYRISKTFEFSASHFLTGLPEGHQCARLHGHNLICRVTLEAKGLNAVGFVMDYGDLSPLKRWLDESFDHRHLNDVVEFNPTAENFAHHIFEWCEAQGWPVVMVEWSETPKTWASYERGNDDVR